MAVLDFAVEDSLNDIVTWDNYLGVGDIPPVTHEDKGQHENHEKFEAFLWVSQGH